MKRARVAYGGAIHDATEHPAGVRLADGRLLAEEALDETRDRLQLALQKLPFDIAPVHVDAVWHRRAQLRASHQWLRQALMRVAQRALQPTVQPTLPPASP